MKILSSWICATEHCFGISVKEGLQRRTVVAVCRGTLSVLFISATGVTYHVRDFYMPKQWSLFKISLFSFCFGCMCVGA